MGKVTAIRTAQGREKQVRVSLDGRFAFSLESGAAALSIGQELSDAQVEELVRSDRFQWCHKAAEKLLSYRPRSEAELKGRLLRRGFDKSSIERVLGLLKQQGLVDDAAFAVFWSSNRQSFSPRSQWLTGLELRRKGVSEDIIGRIAGAVDDGDSAYRAAADKLRSLADADYTSFRRRLGDYLKRRGFSYGVVNRTVRRVWQEQREQSQTNTGIDEGGIAGLRRGEGHDD